MADHNAKGRGHGKRGKYNKPLSVQQKKAIAMLVNQDVTGQSKQDIADELGINISTLWDWRRKPKFIKELNKQAERIQEGIINDAYSQIRQLISNPNTSDANKIQALKLALQNQGKLVDKQEQTIKKEEPEFDKMMEELKGMRQYYNDRE